MNLAIVIAVLICAVRFFIKPKRVSWSGSYQAMAHLFVGGLIGAWMADTSGHAWCMWAAIAMTCVEITAAVVTRMFADDV